MNLPERDETIDRFVVKVAKDHAGIRVVRVPSPDGTIVRFLVAPADKFMDDMSAAQRARQIDAGALPPEIYGHDLFELLNGNVVRCRDGKRISVTSDLTLRMFLDRFFQPTTTEYRVFGQCVDDIREGQRASRKQGNR
jgi:hypothetical protein